MTTDALFWITVGGAIATCMAAIGARALREYSRHDLEEICRRRDQSQRFSTILRDDDDVTLGVEMVVIVGLVLTVLAGCLWAHQHFGPQALALPGSIVVLLAVGLSLLLIALTVWIPWSVSRLGAAIFIYYTWSLWRSVRLLTSAFVWSGRIVDTIFHRIAGRTHEKADEESFEEEIRTIVSEGQREGLLEEEAREMIEGVIELGDADVSEIMTPRTDMNMIQVDQPWDEMIAEVTRFGHTRIPVYDKNRDDIIGILYAKDLLPELAHPNGKPHKSLAELMRKPRFVPETKAVNELLQMFQQTHTHIAVVLDEYGGVSGLVTIEDVLEEIVGEIVDEYDEELEEEIHKLDEDSCEALGRAHVDEINEIMKFQLPEDADFDTIGGFVFSELGRVPLVGEQLVWQDSIQVTVLEASRRRIDRVRVERLPTESREIA